MAGFLDTTEFSVVDFTGGFVDDASSAKPNQYILCDNFTHTREGKLRFRNNMSVFTYHVTGGLTAPFSSANLKAILPFQTYLMAYAGQSFYYTSGNSYTAVSDYVSDSTVTGGETAAHISWSVWQSQIFLCMSRPTYGVAGLPPAKIFIDSGNTWRFVTAGLPALPENTNYYSADILANAITLANELRTDLKRHFVDTAGSNRHPTNDTVSDAIISNGACSNLATLLALTGQMLEAYQNHVLDKFKATPLYHSGSLSGYTDPAVYYYYKFILDSTEVPTTLVEACEALNELKNKYNEHESVAGVGTVYHNSIGSTDPISSSSIVSLVSGPQMTKPLTKVAQAVLQFVLAYNAHESDATEHSATTGASSTYTTAQTTLDTISYALMDVCYLYDVHDQDAETNGALHPAAEYLDHTIPGVDATKGARRVEPTFENIRKWGVNSLADVVEYLKVAAALYNAHDSDDTRGGAHTLADGDHQVELSDIPEIGDYVYGFHYSRTYSVKDADGNTISYEDVGPVTLVDYDDAPEPDKDPNVIINIPALANSSLSHYPTDTLSIHDCETAWTASANVTATANTTYAKVGTYAAKLAVGSSFVTGLVAYKTLTSTDYSGYQKVSFWIMATVNQAAGDFSIKLCSDTAGAVAVDTFSVPALTANVPRYFTIDTSAALGSAIQSVALYINTDNGAVDIYLDDIFAVKSNTAASTKIKIFRTKRDGATLYYLDAISNGTTTYTDRTSDDDLSTETIYTTGGLVERDPAPACEIMHICNDVVYYGYLRETTESIPERIRQSLQGDPDGCPEDFYIDLPGPVRGISSSKNIPIAWTASGTYRLEGLFDETGAGSIRAVPISDVVGLRARYSPVQIDSGVIFAGNDGFYFTDGYQVTPLTKDWPVKYNSDIGSDAFALYIRGCFDRFANKVYWTWKPSTISGTTAPRQILVMDLNFGMKPNMPVTIWRSAYAESLASVEWSVRDIAKWEAYSAGGGVLVSAELNGWNMYWSSTSAGDVLIDLSTSAASWITSGAPKDYVSPAFNFGTERVRKWTPRVSFSLKTNATDIALWVKARTESDTAGNTYPENYLGDLNYPLSGSFKGHIYESRRMYAGGFRCMKRQIRFQSPTDAIIHKSSVVGGTVTVTGGTTATLSGGTWPSAVEKYTLVCSTDPNESSSALRAVVSTRNSDTVLTLATSITNAAYSTWYLVGMPKNQDCTLDSYSIHYAYLGQIIEGAGNDNLS